MYRVAALLFTFTLLLPAPALFADATPEAPTAGRVVLAPLNLGVRAEPQLAPGIEPVWQELVRHFESQDPPPASLGREGAAALWNAAVADSAKDGGERDVYAAYARFAQRVAEQVEYGSLVIPSLVVRKATVHGHQATWDGVLRIVDTPPSVGALDGAQNFWVTSGGVHGALGAASLHVAVFSPEGELRFEGAGGLTLLQRVEMSENDGLRELRVAEQTAAFSDPDALREGIEAAFTRPLPASRARD